MIFLIYLLTAYVLVFYICEYFKRRNYPPGPWPVPIFGNLFQLARYSNLAPNIAIAKIAESYGDIFTLKLGFKEMIILSSHKSITEILTREESLGRDVSGMMADRNLGKTTLGFGLAEGEFWRTKRAWTIQHLKDNGFNKSTSMEYICSEEVGNLLNNIEQNFVNGEGVVKMEKLFSFPTFKIMWTIVRGENCDKYEGVMQQVVEKSNKWADNGLFGAGIVNAFPFLRYMFPKLTSYDLQMDFYSLARQVGQDLLKEVQQTMKEKESNSSNSLIEAYVLKMKEENSRKYFNEEDFGILFLDLLQASSDTTACYLESLMLNAVLYPDAQDKIYKEIEEYMPNGEKASLEYMKRMIYTQAFMLEVHRRCTTVQNLIPRRITKDFIYRGYTINRNKVVMADLYTPYNNPDIWTQPALFNPERFINESGQLINQNLIISFSIGKRGCPGQNLAECESFMFFISILQKYKLSVVPGQKPPREDMHVSLTCRPYPFEVLFKKRI